MSASIAGELSSPSAARTFDLEELVVLAQAGRVRVPHFQRDFRWELQDVRRLFDSVVRGYPIGSLLLWQRAAPAASLELGALRIDAPKLDSALWVVDGQQRLTSLANALSDTGYADPRFGLNFDLQRSEFRPRREVSPDTTIPLPVLFDLRRLLAWFNSRPDLADYVVRANDIATRLRQFAVPSYVVHQADIHVLQDIFDRMNNFGKRLSRAEIFSALYAPDEAADKDALTIGRVAERLDDETGFGRLDDDTVLRAILARRGPDVTREIRIEFDQDRRDQTEFPYEDRDVAFAVGEHALRKAIEFLRLTAGVPHFSFLPYRYLLVVLARFLGHFPDPDPRTLVLLRRWFWRAAVAGPELFKGSATGAMRTLCARVTPGAESLSTAGLLAAVERAEGRVLGPNFERFRTNEASTRLLLAGMWAQQPLSPATGQPYGEDALTIALAYQTSAFDVAREVLRRRALPGAQRTWAANRVLLPDQELPLSEVDSLFSAPTRAVASDADLWERVLRSHCMDLDCSLLLRQGDNDAFLQRRQEILREVVGQFLKSACEWEFEDTPPLSALDLDEDGDQEVGRHSQIF